MRNSIRARSAVTVVSRSSKVSTGTVTTVASCSASAMAPLAAGPQLPRQRERQADDDALGLLLVDQRRQASMVLGARTGALHDGQRGRDRAAAVGHGDADPLAAEVDAEGSHGEISCQRARAAATAARAIRSASSRPDGSLPPATATSPLPPPPPLTAFAASLTRSPAWIAGLGVDRGDDRRAAGVGLAGRARPRRRHAAARRWRAHADRSATSRRCVRPPRRRRRPPRGRRRARKRHCARSTFSSSSQRGDLVELAPHALDQGVGLAADEPGRLADRPLVTLQEVHASRAGDRLDAAQVGADRALADDLDRADVAGRPHVRAAAQLEAVAPRLEHPHDVAVLVAEEGDRPHRQRLVLGGLVGAHAVVGQHLAVGELLDALDLLVGDATRSG